MSTLRVEPVHLLDDDCAEFSLIDEAGEEIAVVTGREWADKLAAAPELLELAQQFASECAGCGGSAETIHANGPAPEDEYSLPCEDCADIRKVIAKAMGGHVP